MDRKGDSRRDDAPQGGRECPRPRGLAVTDEKAELRVCPVLKATCQFDLAVHQRAQAGFAAFQAVARGADAQARLAYFEGGVLERLGEGMPRPGSLPTGAHGRSGTMRAHSGLTRCLLALNRAADGASTVGCPGPHARRSYPALAGMDPPMSRGSYSSPAVMLAQVVNRFGDEHVAKRHFADGQGQPLGTRELAAGRPLRINCGGPTSPTRPELLGAGTGSPAEGTSFTSSTSMTTP